MVETRHLQPPVTGPQSDPLLFGVTEALALLFPIEEAKPHARIERSEQADDEPIEEPLAA